MDELAWSRRLGAGALILAATSVLVVLANPGLGVQGPGDDAGSGGLLSSLSALEAMVVLFGPPLLVALAGLALYARLDEEARSRARIALWAPAVIVGVPVAILILYMVALSTLGPV